jgi:hypothetical protein
VQKKDISLRIFTVSLADFFIDRIRRFLNIFILAGLAAKELPGYREEAARKVERRLLVELSAQLLNAPGRPTSEQVTVPGLLTSFGEHVAATGLPTSEQVTVPDPPTSLSEQMTDPDQSHYLREQVAAPGQPTSLREQVAAPGRPTSLRKQVAAPGRPTSLREQVAAPGRPTFLREPVAAPDRPTSMAAPSRPSSLREQLTALDWGLDRLLRPDILELAGRRGKEVEEEWQRFRNGFLQLFQMKLTGGYCT